jgi:hypothetical protein
MSEGLRRPADSINRSRRRPPAHSQIIDDHVGALVGKRQSTARPVRRQTAGGMNRTTARANTFRRWVSVAFCLPLLWTAPIRQKELQHE